MKKIIIVFILLPLFSVCQSNYTGNIFTAKSYFNAPAYKLNGVTINFPTVDNTLYGLQAGNALTTGTNNSFIGYRAGYTVTSGVQNTFVGHYSGNSSTANQRCTSVGYQSGYGSRALDNVFIGANSGYGARLGNNNTIIGSSAGYSVYDGSNNIMIGYKAGFNETSSNKLYIENSDADSTNALIFGNFATNTLKINGNLITSGDITSLINYHVAVYRNTDLTISASLNVWYKITGFTTKDADGVVVAGDSIQLTKVGHYLVNYVASFSGLNNEIWELGVFKNGALEQPSQLIYTSSSDVGNANCPVYVSSDGNDWISFKIRNTTDNDDPVIKRFSGIISIIHNQ